MGVHLLIRHYTQGPDGGILPFHDTTHPLHPVCESGAGLRFILDGLVGEKVVVGQFDPDVNRAAMLAEEMRRQDVEPPDAYLIGAPAVAAGLFWSSYRQREAVRARAREVMARADVDS